MLKALKALLGMGLALILAACSKEKAPQNRSHHTDLYVVAQKIRHEDFQCPKVFNADYCEVIAEKELPDGTPDVETECTSLFLGKNGGLQTIFNFGWEQPRVVDGSVREQKYQDKTPYAELSYCTGGELHVHVDATSGSIHQIFAASQDGRSLTIRTSARGEAKSLSGTRFLTYDGTR